MFSRDQIKVSTYTAKWVCENHKEKEFIFFLKIKKFFRNGIIENPFWRFSEFKKEFGFSEKSYRRRLNECIDLGWLKQVVRKNRTPAVICVDIDQLPKTEYGVERYMKFLKSELSIELIRLLPIKVCESSQKTILLKASRKDKTVVRGRESVLYHKQLGQACPYSTIPNQEITLSARGISKLINRKSAMTGHRLRVKCSQLGLLKYQNRYYKPKPCGVKDGIKKKIYYEKINGVLYAKLNSSLEVCLPNSPSKLIAAQNFRKREGFFIAAFMMDCIDF